MAPKARSSPAAPEVWTLVDPNGTEFTTSDAVARYNLLAQGYKDKDPEAGAKLAASREKKASDPEYAAAADPTTYRSARR